MGWAANTKESHREAPSHWQIKINIYDLRLAAVRWWPGPGVVSCS